MCAGLLYGFVAFKPPYATLQGNYGLSLLYRGRLF